MDSLISKKRKRTNIKIKKDEIKEKRLKNVLFASYPERVPRHSS